MAIIFTIFLLLIPIRATICDWEIVLVIEPLFWAENHRTKESGYFLIGDVTSRKRNNIYEGSMFNTYIDGNEITVVFCEEEIA